MTILKLEERETIIFKFKKNYIVFCQISKEKGAIKMEKNNEQSTTKTNIN